MLTIDLPREAKGSELTDVIRQAAEENRFTYLDGEGNISVERQFPERVPAHLKGCFDVIPSLSVRFGAIEPDKTYKSLQCSTWLGTLMLEKVCLEWDAPQYMPYYNWLVLAIYSRLKQK